MKLKVGDRIVVIKEGDNTLKVGMKGVVMGFDRNDVPWVEFDENFGGHNGNGKGIDGHCWFVYDDSCEYKIINVPNNPLSRVLYPDYIVCPENPDYLVPKEE